MDMWIEVIKQALQFAGITIAVVAFWLAFLV